MTTTTAALVAPKTVDAILTDLLAAAAARGLPVTAWQPLNALRTLLYADATVLADVYALRALLAGSAFLDDAEEDWLTLLAASVFDVARTASTYATGDVVLTVAAGAGPYTIAANGLLVSDGTRRWRSTNTGNVTISSATPVSVEVSAESPGTDYNVAPATITSIITPALAGVSVNNPVGADGTWLTSAGADEESDDDLRQRCRDRWATLGSGFTRAAVRYWCTSAAYADGTTVGCTRVAFAPPPGDGTYTVYVAGSAGPLGSGGVARVQAIIDAACPITDDPTIAAAVQTTIAVEGNVRMRTGYNTSTNRDAVRASIAAFVNGLDIGDDVGGVTLDRSGIDAAIYSAIPGGIADVDLTLPAGDTTLALGRVAVANVTNLTFSG